ncbi:MAG: lanthionine synthetase LanC family protein [Pseudonocardiaceae bacterium]
MSQTGPLRPSWCYGIPGIARAQQIAAIATGDTSRQTMAEHTLATCLSDPSQLRQITDTGLCHGWSGLYQTTWRTARDSPTPAISTRLPHLAERLTRNAEAAEHHDAGLLDGAAGLALALHTATRTTPSISG